MALDGIKLVENTRLCSHMTLESFIQALGEKRIRGLHIMRSGVPSTRGELTPSVAEPKGIPNHPWLSESICFINCDRTFTLRPCILYSISFTPQNNSLNLGVTRPFHWETTRWDDLPCRVTCWEAEPAPQ